MDDNISTPPWHAATNPSIAEASTTLDDLIEKVKTVEELTAEVAVLTNSVTDLTARLELSRQRTERTQTRVNEYAADVTRLNELMNEKADEQSLCGKYEEALAEWNSELTHIELTGRVKEYEVSVTVTATYHTTVTVEASSEDDAAEKVNDMDTDDIDSNSGLEWRYPDDAEFVVDEVCEA